MKISIKTIVAGMPNEELKTAFLELSEWINTGILTDGIVRRYHALYEEKMGYEIDLKVTERAILFELGKRAVQVL